MNYPNIVAIAADNADLLAHRLNPDQDQACNAYATELLPHILGGQWIKSKGSDTRVVWDGGIPDLVPRLVLYGGLFDHLAFFRPKGSRGVLSWSNTVVIGQPYGTKDGDVDDEDNHAAAGLVAQGVGVWASRELSTWYPGWTVLILAARALLSLDAARFRFIALPAGKIVR